jgi:cytochrome b561
MAAPDAGLAIGRESLQNRLHVAVAVLCAWLVFTCPWIAMLRRVPRGAGFFDYAHVALGLLALAVGLVYAALCVRSGRWRLYFPWLAGEWAPTARDLAGLVRGRLPSAEGGGLFAVIEGLLLLAVVLVGVTGGAWFVSQGGDAAILFRECHVIGADVLIGLAIAHVLAVATHLLELA